MAGHNQTIRPNSSHYFLYKIILLLTILPFLLAIFAFFLQWRGGFGFDDVYNNPRLSLESNRQFPGLVENPVRNNRKKCENCDLNVLKQRNLNSPVFPYFRNWGFNYNHSNDRLKICITTSTSAGLEQLLPWIFYHKVIGFTNFFLFVEGKAATPKVSKVLASIQGVQVVYRTRELEDQQSKRYQEHVVWKDETLKLKLMKYNILTRIYAPMVIIEGLRESGVFASVIASAQTNSSDTRKSDSIEKVGVGRLLLSRKVVENEDTDELQAIPPLSPPGIDVD